MKMKANVLAVFSDTFTDDKTKEVKPYFQLEVIDTEARKKEVIRCKLKADQLDVANTLVGKVGHIDVEFLTGKIAFIGVALAKSA